jgi:hypothetical protein
MTPQLYEDDDAVSSERIACVWNGMNVHIIVLSTEEALSSARVPDLVLSYVFTHHIEDSIS